jgi:2-oxoglutarate ferredoxin oxidoreductase subunit alpha
MTPVLLLTDGYLANGSEPWRIPQARRAAPHPGALPHGAQRFPALRRDERLARPWAIPGTPGLEHRVGGLEKANLTGNVSYDGGNHELMCRLRAEKIRRIADTSRRPRSTAMLDGDVLVVGWGGTYGAIRAGVDKVLARRPPRRARAPAPPEPAAQRPRRHPAPLQEGARARAQPRPALARSCATAI